MENMEYGILKIFKTLYCHLKGEVDVMGFILNYGIWSMKH